MSQSRSNSNNNQSLSGNQSSHNANLEAEVLPYFMEKEMQELQQLAEKLRLAEAGENDSIAELLQNETEESLNIAYLINAQSAIFPSNLVALTKMLQTALQKEDIQTIQKLSAECASDRLESAYTLLAKTQSRIKKSYLQDVRPTSTQLLQSGGIFGPPGGMMLLNEEKAEASNSPTFKC